MSHCASGTKKSHQLNKEFEDWYKKILFSRDKATFFVSVLKVFNSRASWFPHSISLFFEELEKNFYLKKCTFYCRVKSKKKYKNWFRTTKSLLYYLILITKQHILTITKKWYQNHTMLIKPKKKLKKPLQTRCKCWFFSRNKEIR